MEYTLDNTAEADYCIHYGILRSNYFYRNGNNGNLDLLNDDGNWEGLDINNSALGGNIFELSRPQSDIDALFNDAPDWATGYAKVGVNQRVCWVNSDGYMYLGGVRLFYYGCEDNFVEVQFTIIATRPPVEQSIVFVENKAIEFKSTGMSWDKDRPVYTQTMADNGEGPMVGCECIVIPHNLGWGFTSITEQKGKIIAVVDESFWWKGERDNCISRLDKVNFKPINQRTDREKVIDALSGVDNCYMPMDDAIGLFDDIQSGKIPFIEYTGK